MEDIPSRLHTPIQAMPKASLGIESGSACRCKYCKTFRCLCKKGGRICNIKCHTIVNLNKPLLNYLCNYIYSKLIIIFIVATR